MVHTKVRGNWSTGSWKGFYYIWAWQPYWSCDQHPLYKFSYPYTLKLTYKILYKKKPGPVVSEKNKF